MAVEPTRGIGGKSSRSGRRGARSIIRHGSLGVLLPRFRRLNLHQITATDDKDKAFEYGKGIWMRFVLPTMHILYVSIQAKKGKIDLAAVSKTGSANVAERGIGSAGGSGAMKPSQIMFLERDDILSLYAVSNIPLPAGRIASPVGGRKPAAPRGDRTREKAWRPVHRFH